MLDERRTEVYEGTAGDAAQQAAVRHGVHWLCAQARGDEILEVGCGQGIAAILLAREGRRVTAVDADAEAIDFARGRARDEEPEARARLRFLHLQPGDLGHAGGPFDSVLVHHLLERAAMPEPLLEAFAGALRPEGRLAVLAAYVDDEAGRVTIAELLRWLRPAFALERIELVADDVALTALPAGGAEPTRGDLDAALDVAERGLAAQRAATTKARDSAGAASSAAAAAREELGGLRRELREARDALAAAEADAAAARIELADERGRLRRVLARREGGG